MTPGALIDLWDGRTVDVAIPVPLIAPGYCAIFLPMFLPMLDQLNIAPRVDVINQLLWHN